jgi:chromosome segregation ATPase
MTAAGLEYTPPPPPPSAAQVTRLEVRLEALDERLERVVDELSSVREQRGRDYPATRESLAGLDARLDAMRGALEGAARALEAMSQRVQAVELRLATLDAHVGVNVRQAAVAAGGGGAAIATLSHVVPAILRWLGAL